MFDDFQIGSGSCGYMANKVKNFEKLSSNNVSFWTYGCVLESSFRIMKDTEEGKELTRLIQEDAIEEEIYDYLDQLALKHLPIEIVHERIRRIKQRSFELGMLHKQREIKDILGIEE